MLKKVLYMIMGMAALTACDDNAAMENPFLNGVGKTPVAVCVGMADGTAMTRAVDKMFESGDELIAYIRHVKKNGSVYELVSETGVGPRLAKFTVATINDEHKDEANNYDQTVSTLNLASGETALYWDDFSRASTESETAGNCDIRTSGHGLEVYYGYCYNGGTPSTDLNESEGTLTWAVKEDQNTAANQKNSDLLFAKRQTPPATYNHDKNSRGKLQMDFTHAMSMVTVELVCADGFDANVDENFNSASVTINGVNAKSEVSAPDEKVKITTTEADKKDITMKKGAITQDKLNCTFSAIVAPTLIKANPDQAFLTITNIDGNNYNLYLTDAILNNSSNEQRWSTKLASSSATEVTPGTTAGYTSEDGGYTLPGVNYYIKVTLKKQAIDANATIRDWSSTSAEGDGTIDIPDGADEYFIEDDTNPGVANATIEVKTVDKDKFVDASSFSLYILKHDDGSDTSEKRTNTSYDWVTTCSFVDETAEGKEDYWNNDPQIYWPNVTDKYYFRALAKFNSLNDSKYDISSVHDKHNTTKTASADETVSQGIIAEGKDILWATTPRHYGRSSDYDSDNENSYRTYDKGAAIPPRKGGVPMAFEHIMSKVTFNLEDANKNAALPDGVAANDYDNPLNPRIDLSDATIQLTNLSTRGTVNVEDGEVTASTPVVGNVFGDGKGYNPSLLNGTPNTLTNNLLKDYIMVPQTIDDTSILTVTLKDGTTYKLQLNTCVQDGTTTSITAWLRGMHYTYTITLKKEAISFRVMIKNWDEKKGSGNANLDWD